MQIKIEKKIEAIEALGEVKDPDGFLLVKYFSRSFVSAILNSYSFPSEWRKYIS